MSESADFSTESCALIIGGVTYPLPDRTRCNRDPVITIIAKRGLAGQNGKRQITPICQGHTAGIDVPAVSSRLDAARDAWTASTNARITPAVSFIEIRFYPEGQERRTERTDGYVISSWTRQQQDGSESTHSISMETGDPNVY